MYQSFISLEVRVLLPSRTKAFCRCGFATDGTAQTCPVCRNEAKAKPELDREAALKAYLAAGALGCELFESAGYERNLATPELPPCYAISGNSVLIGRNGYLESTFHKKKNRIRIAELRMEEHAGRLVHSGNAAHFDYSHAGMPSMRIRTEADMEIGEEAEVFLQELWKCLEYLVIPSGRPREETVRCNAYVALSEISGDAGEYVKLRNLNSFNFVRKAINYELNRQEDLLERGETVEPESRVWNEAKSVTERFQKRTVDLKSRFVAIKGQSPFTLDDSMRTSLGETKIERPAERAARITKAYGLNLHQAAFICDARSRADFFETCVSLGARADDAAHWISSDGAKIARRLGLQLGMGPLSPGRFARVLELLAQGSIHGPIARQLLWAVANEDKDPDRIIAERSWSKLPDDAELEKAISAVLEKHKAEADKIRSGDPRPIQFLIGAAMEATNELADPSRIRDILKTRLSLSFIHVLSLGGAISGTKSDGGIVAPGDDKSLARLLGALPGGAGLRWGSVQLKSILSEEIVPEDWAALITAISEKIATGTASGIVVTHGTDTLAYTASLLYWLFADAEAPIVLTASMAPPGADGEAMRNLEKAVSLAGEKTRGVYVVFGDKVLSPLNLKFEKPSENGFRNWNMVEPLFTGASLVEGELDADRYVITQLLEETINKTCVLKVYPGLRSDYLIALMNAGVRHFILELYDSGTANLREGPYSLKEAFAYGKRRGVSFYCTSQQEGIVDFSGYTTSHKLWREGAVPMGGLTTESAYTKLLAASLIAESDEELASLMDQPDETRA